MPPEPLVFGSDQSLGKLWRQLREADREAPAVVGGQKEAERLAGAVGDDGRRRTMQGLPGEGEGEVDEEKNQNRRYRDEDGNDKETAPPWPPPTLTP
jgi:hypothetical protein